MLISELKGRDIAILGGGREGRTVVSWLHRHLPGQSLTLYDEGSVPFTGDENARVLTGPFTAAALAQHEVIIRSPGISPYRPELQAARRAGVRFTSASSLWFANNPQAKTICITGTKGKSTTAALTAHLLEACGQSVVLAGNIGVPLLDCDGQTPDWWVIELSSYQLADLQARPTVSAIINISDEHLDWHGGAAAYRRDKLRLANLAGDGPLIINAGDGVLYGEFCQHKNIHWFARSEGWHVQNDCLYRHHTKFSHIPRQALPGAHNLLNLAAALTILDTIEAKVLSPEEALQGFSSLPHRLQVLGSRDDILYVNDSLSTTPVSTVAGLQAFAGRNVILLVGGLDRGLDWSLSMQAISDYCPKAVITLPDNGPAIAECMQKAQLEPGAGIHLAANLEDAMKIAGQMAQPGDLVLLSPGAPSFPHFQDFADRGRQFAALAGAGLT